jgi:hypothetical protein
MLANWYAPDSLLRTVVTIPVATFVAVIVTPGIRAPVESDTVPPNVAFVVCENVYAQLNRRTIVVVMTIPLIASPFFVAGKATNVGWNRAGFSRLVIGLLTGH